MLVAAPGRNSWTALEAKVPGGRVRPEQRRLVEVGCSAIVTDLDEAMAALTIAEPERSERALALGFRRWLRAEQYCVRRLGDTEEDEAMVDRFLRSLGREEVDDAG